MNIDNQGTAALWTDPPAPQADEPDHYASFLDRICQRYLEQYADLDKLPEPHGLSPEDALPMLARKYPGLLDETGRLVIDADLTGAPELQAILSAIEQQARSR